MTYTNTYDEKIMNWNRRDFSMLVEQMDECEILAGIEAAVRGKAAQSLCDGSIGRSNDALGL